jgi:hypothetical protein
MSLSRKTWLGVGLVAPTLALGCHSTLRHNAGGCSTCGGAVVQAPAAHAGVVPGHPAVTPYGPVASARVPEVNHEMTAPPPAPLSAAVPRAHRLDASAAERVPTSPAPHTSAGYHHSPDYRVLVGELFHNARHDTWRLRYAGIDVEDRYGGCVTLANVGREMIDFKNGQYVRVEGVVVDPESREVSPAYRVRDILPAGPRQ